MPNLFLLLLTVLQHTWSATGNPTANNDCPLWFVPGDNGTCECGNDLGGIVKCNNVSREVYLLEWFCMSQDSTGLVVGACPYHNHWSLTGTFQVHYLLPKNISDLEDLVCGPYNRKGRMCGQCKDGFTTSAYSYDLICVKCSGGHYNWAKYVAVALLPLTAFFIVVVTFRISVTLPPMVALVHILQPIVVPQAIRVSIFALTAPILSPAKILACIIYTIYGVWNLDFFRTVIPPEAICLEMSTIQALALDYLVALYPLILIVITYILIELHAWNFWPLVWVWKPVQYCITRCGIRRQWNFKSSIIEAFASFLLLSFGKMLSISFDLLVPTQLYNIHGERVNKTYLFYDATVEVFSSSHLILAFVAMAVLIVFILLPLLLLLLYPLRCFHKCLDCCRIRCHALMVFTDAFQGAYKNGTNGTRDHRWFALVYPSARILSYITYALTLSSFSFALITFLLIGIAALITVVQPYKKAPHNIIDTLLMLTLTLITASKTSQISSIERQHTQSYAADVLFVLASLIPLLYLTAIPLHWVYGSRVFGLLCRMCRWCKQVNICCTRGGRRREGRLALSGTLPDRMANPDEYILLDGVVGQWAEDHHSE